MSFFSSVLVFFSVDIFFFLVVFEKLKFIEFESLNFETEDLDGFVFFF